MSNKFKLLDLFSGIGGFSLGLERSGYFETVAFCEIDPFCRRVLKKHWPEVPQYDDVKTLTADRLAADGIAVDAICGGFPCQDISTAGKQAGIGEGTRSGLYSEVIRLAGELQPKVIILENVAALLSGENGRWFGRVLGDLAALGYDAEWHCIPASALGAPHRRDRVWVIANANGIAKGGLPERASSQFSIACYDGEILANTISVRQQGQRKSVKQCSSPPYIDRQAIDAFTGSVGSIWRAEPAVGRVANGVPDRSHRLKALGNAVVPQIPELIGRAIGQSFFGERTAA